MKLSKLLQVTLLGAAALGMGTGGAFAVCAEFGGYAVFQCGDLAYIAPAPFQVTFDAANRPTNVLTTYWQLGFGNNLINDGNGTTGTGNENLTTFNGNDAGIAVVDLADATAVDPRFPAGTLCLRSNNWGNSGVDGCCDNNRNASVLLSDDDILNPYYHVYYSRAFGYPGYYSLMWQQEYPMAMLAKDTDTGRWFALAAVSTLDRGNIGGNGPCDTVFGGGTNPAPCDFRVGAYFFREITNGLPNTATPGVNNVVGWQEVPRPKAACTAGCSGAGTRTVDFNWPVVRWYDDNELRPSTNPSMAPADATRAGGVGTRDLRRKTTSTNWQGLVHYTLQQANVTAGDIGPGGVNYAGLAWFDVVANIPQPTSPLTGNPTVTSLSATGVSAPVDSCWRIRVDFGKLTEVPAGPTSIANCRVGKCGDRGYFVASVDPNSITCVGGALVSEKAEQVRAEKSQGGINVSWVTTAELSMTGFDIIAVTKNGQETSLGHVACKSCTSGLGESYSFDAGKGSLKGGVTAVRLEVRGANPSSVQVPLE